MQNQIGLDKLTQEYLLKLIEKATFDIKAVESIRNYIRNCENVCTLLDRNGCHIVQSAMINSPSLIETILSINEKTLGLGSTPDVQGRLPSVYWIASGNAQYIQKTAKTTVLIPKRIDEETWYQAAELAYELEFGSIGLCSKKVQKNFEETTGKKLDEWIEEEAANGNPWFEHMIDIAVERAKKGLSSPIFLHSNIIDIWADPDNQRVVNEAHALFRAHLILANYSVYDNDIKKQNLKEFLKTHLSGKTFDTLKGQINNGESFMNSIQYICLLKSQWWKEICMIMEREGLSKKFADAINTQAPKYKFNTL